MRGNGKYLAIGGLVVLAVVGLATCSWAMSSAASDSQAIQNTSDQSGRGTQPGRPAETSATEEPANDAAESYKILCISDSPESVEVNYYQMSTAAIYLVDSFIHPAKMTAEDMSVESLNWLAASKLGKADLNGVDAVILWDAPHHITDDRNMGPMYSDMAVLSNEVETALVEWVHDGGTLIMAGGVTCYGDAPCPPLGATQNNGDRRYFGYADSPIGAILPVMIPDGQTLVARVNDAGELLTARTVAEDDPMVAGLDFDPWPFNAYHKVRAREGAEVLVSLENGDPLLVRGTHGKGRVVCITASSRGNILVQNKIKPARHPVWVSEPILLDRVLRWGLGLEYNPIKEAKAVIQLMEGIQPPTSVPQSVREQEFPYITHTLNSVLPGYLKGLPYKWFHDIGFNHIITQAAPLASAEFIKHYAEQLERYNLCALLHTDIAIHTKHVHSDPNEWAQVTRPGNAFAPWYGEIAPCPYSKLVQQAACDQVKKFMPVVKPYKAIRGSLHDDEWAWCLGYRNPYQGQQGIACFSPWVNERYEDETEMAVPEVVYREPGYVAPKDDPFIKWCQVVRRDAYREYNQVVSDTFESYRPDFITSNYPGGFEGNTDVMIEEVYLDCWKESELETLERIDVRANFREDKTRQECPAWALIGIFRMPEDKSIYPETLRLTAGLCLGGGFKGIILWNSVNLWAPNLQIEGREPLYKEATRLGDYLERFGTMFPKLDKETSDIWVQSGWFWVNTYDAYYHLPPSDPCEFENRDMERTWWQFQVSDIAGPALLRSGLYAEFVTEKQLMSGDLFDKAAVVLPGMLYCRQEVIDNLEDYIAQGGHVFVDESTKIDVEGAKVLPIDFSKWHYDIAAGKRPVAGPTEPTYQKHRAMRQAYVDEAIPVIREHILPVVSPRVRFDSDKAVYTMMKNGKTRYLFVYNSDVYNGHTFQVSTRRLPEVVYDIAASQRVTVSTDKPGVDEFQVTLPAGGWKVFAMPSAPVDAVQVDYCAMKGSTLELQATVRKADGELLSAAVPMAITLCGKSNGKGKADTEYTVYRSSSEGTLDVSLLCEGALPSPATVTVTELFSGQSAVFALTAEACALKK